MNKKAVIWKTNWMQCRMQIYSNPAITSLTFNTREMKHWNLRQKNNY